jgi:hypothetical protein
MDSDRNEESSTIPTATAKVQRSARSADNAVRRQIFGRNFLWRLHAILRFGRAASTIFQVMRSTRSKWFIKRGRRGWADCDASSLDCYLSGWLPAALRHLKKTRRGLPGILEKIRQGGGGHLLDWEWYGMARVGGLAVEHRSRAGRGYLWHTTERISRENPATSSANGGTSRRLGRYSGDHRGD